ncbi:MAG: hypothetical protein JO001_08885 [Alphaproteobacteria bacterium]|nr:hypothetical protein [Alphaproteobacteria bacterium]
MVALESELPSYLEPRPATTADAIPIRLRRVGATPRQVLALSLIGALTLAVFASHDLASWLDRMGGSPALAPLQHAAARWDHAMASLGLGRPAEALRYFIQRLQDQDWPSAEK